MAKTDGEVLLSVLEYEKALAFVTQDENYTQPVTSATTATAAPGAMPSNAEMAARSVRTETRVAALFFCFGLLTD